MSPGQEKSNELNRIRKEIARRCVRCNGIGWYLNEKKEFISCHPCEGTGQEILEKKGDGS